MIAALVLAASVVAVEGDYVVRAGEAARVVEVEARFSSLPGQVLAIERGCGAYVSGLEMSTPAGWSAVERRGDAAFPACGTGPCRVRYRFGLAEAARALKNRNVAFEHGGAFLAPPSSFLLRPARGAAGRFRLEVHTASPTRFVTGLRAAGGGWTAGWDDLPQAPWSGFGPFLVERVDVPGGALDLAVAPGAEAPSLELLKRWASRAGDAVATVYGGMPLPRVQVLVLPGTPRPGVGFGTTLGNGGAAVMIWMGRGTTAAHLDGDWVLVHELMHVGLPNVDRSHRWLEEGLATYLEEVGRARAGHISQVEAWTSFARGLPKGLPQAGDRGLDHTHTWGRTYWGGALFALVADVTIREHTGGRKGLDDALRAIVATSGTIATRRPVAEVLAAGDGGTGTRVLAEMYARWSGEPVHVDLAELFDRLGVRGRETAVVLDGTARGAAVRRALTTKNEGTVPP